MPRHIAILLQRECRATLLLLQRECRAIYCYCCNANAALYCYTAILLRRECRAIYCYCCNANAALYCYCCCCCCWNNATLHCYCCSANAALYAATAATRMPRYTAILLRRECLLFIANNNRYFFVPQQIARKLKIVRFSLTDHRRMERLHPSSILPKKPTSCCLRSAHNTTYYSLPPSPNR